MEIFSSRIEEPYLGFTRPLYCFQPEKLIIIRITSTKLNDAVRSHYIAFITSYD